MNYETTYRRDPDPAAAAKFVNYLRGGSSIIRRGAGPPATDADLDRFRELVADSEVSRHHVFAFTENYDAEWLADQVADPLRDQLGGTFMLGVHTDTDHNHVHVAQAGREEECFMDRDDLDRVRRSVASQVSEPLGEGTTA
jgi:hypothetical protein